MALFGRRKQPEPQVRLIGATGVLPDTQVPGHLLVGAVTEPGRPDPAGEAALVSGLLLGPFPVQLVQITAAAPRATWPRPDQQLPAAVDPGNPLNFVVQWAETADDGRPPPPVHIQSGPSGWDAGPNGQHAAMIADWLAARGLTVGDFGGLLDAVAPGLSPLLDAASSRYATVIRGGAALALMNNGRPARGTVVAAQVLPMPPQMLPSPSASMAWLTLQVTPENGMPYQTRIRFGFRTPERFQALATVGTELPLRVDAANPNVVTIDLPALGITPG